MDVHLGKFLIMACIFNCLDAALAITVRGFGPRPLEASVLNSDIPQATLNSKSPWLTPFGRESEADAVKRGFKIENSDFLTTYNAYCSWREASGNGYEREFCRVSSTKATLDRALLTPFLRRAEELPQSAKPADD